MISYSVCLVDKPFKPSLSLSLETATLPGTNKHYASVILLMLSVIILNVIMLSVIMLSVIMLNVIMLSVILLSVIMLSVILAMSFWPCHFG